MSDDTNALVERLRRWHSEGGSLTARDAADTIEHLLTECAKAERLWKEAAIDASAKYDTIQGLENAYKQLGRDRDALAERCEKLREALRRVAVKPSSTVATHCALCEGSWAFNRPDGEWHEPGCFAAPKDEP